MFSKKQINIRTMSIVIMGLVAFIFCQIHPVIGDEHGPATKAEESCQITALPSAIIAAPIVAGPDETSGHGDSLVNAFTALFFVKVFWDGVTGKAGPLIYPDGTKRYQLICTYRL